MLKKCVFNRLSIGMIPRSYRESLTYEEQILWLQKYLNDMLEWLTKLQEDFDNIDINFDEIENEINGLRTDVNYLQDLIVTKASKEELNTAISNLNYDLRSVITQEYEVLKEYVDTQDEDLQYQIDHFDAQNVVVYDPTTGLESPIQIVINNIYGDTRIEAITAGEYDSLSITAGDYDALNITALNYDRFGKTILSEI